MPDRHTWDAYEKLVLGKLDDHTASLKAVHSEVVKLQVEIAVVKTKLGFIGVISGIAGTVVTMLAKQFLDRQGTL